MHPGKLSTLKNYASYINLMFCPICYIGKFYNLNSRKKKKKITNLPQAML